MKKKLKRIHSYSFCLTWITMAAEFSINFKAKKEQFNKNQYKVHTSPHIPNSLLFLVRTQRRSLSRSARQTKHVEEEQRKKYWNFFCWINQWNFQLVLRFDVLPLSWLKIRLRFSFCSTFFSGRFSILKSDACNKKRAHKKKKKHKKENVI